MTNESEEPLRAAVDYVAHLLPAQGPISVFIHHNVLHAFEGAPFEDAVAHAARIYGAEPFWTAQRYRAMFETGRITHDDLRAVLEESLGARAEERVAGLVTRRELAFVMTRYGIPFIRGQALEWHLSEEDATRRFRDDLPPAARATVAATGAGDPTDVAHVVGSLWAASLEATLCGSARRAREPGRPHRRAGDRLDSQASACRAQRRAHDEHFRHRHDREPDARARHLRGRRARSSDMDGTQVVRDHGRRVAARPLVDGWGLTFALVAAVICGTVSAFSYRYLHLERGFVRYFTLYACFVLGVQLVALAGSIEVLFAGWELLGLSSSLLIAFFHERRSPVRNGMRVYAIYRVSDAAMLIAAVLVHHVIGSGSLSTLFRAGTLAAEAKGSHAELTAISFFFLLAAAGKSGLVPFSNWLPRAMEGPTPSSAVYYGALSVHAGCYLLWRAEPLIRSSFVAQLLVVAVGAATVMFCALAARVQTNVKSALSYATLTQVGVIVVEIGLGFRTLAFVHLLGNACIRLVQFLTAPNVLLDLHGLEGAGVEHGARRPKLYALALHQGGLDVILDALIVRPFFFVAGLGQRLDARLSGERPAPGPIGRETRS